MKSVKSLLIPFIIMICLIVGTVVYFAMSSSDSNTTETTEADMQIMYISVSDVSSIRVDKADGTFIGFNSAIQEDGTATYSFIDGVEVDPAFSISNSKVETYIAMLTNFNANSKLTEVQQLSEYGLDNPAYRITVVTNDNQTHVISMGNKTPDGSYAYVMIDGSNDVYTVAASKLVYCNYGLIDFMGAKLLNIEYAQISTIEFARREDGITLISSCEIDESTGEPFYYFTSPFSIKASPYYENLIEYVATLEISSYLDIPEENLSEYGLENPAYSFTFNMKDGRVITIELSEDRNGYFYGTSSVSDQYFVLSSQQIVGLDTSILNLIEAYVSYHTVSEVSSISGTYGDETFNMNIEVSDRVSSSDSVVTLNSRNAIVYLNQERSRSYAGMVFEAFATIEIAGIDYDEPQSSESVAHIRYVLNDHTVVELDFVERNADTYYVYMNGEYSLFYVKADELFGDGYTDSYGYGLFPAVNLCRRAIDNELGGVCDFYELVTGESGES